MPALWRNYYDIVGYRRDARSRALWLKPILAKAPPPLPAKSDRPAPVDSKSLAKIDPYRPIQASKASKSAGTSVEVDTTGRY